MYIHPVTEYRGCDGEKYPDDRRVQRRTASAENVRREEQVKFAPEPVFNECLPRAAAKMWVVPRIMQNYSSLSVFARERDGRQFFVYRFSSGQGGNANGRIT